MMNERPEDMHTRIAEYPPMTVWSLLKIIEPTNWIALGFGLLLSFLTANSILSLLGPEADSSFPPWSTWFYLPLSSSGYIIVLLPLCLGFAIPFVASGYKKRRISSILTHSLLVWAGISVYWFPLALYQEKRWQQESLLKCQQVYGHGFCGFYLGAGSLFIYLLCGAVLILFCAACTAFISKLRRKFFPYR